MRSFFAAGASAAEAAYGLDKSADQGASWAWAGQGLPVHSRINALRAVGKMLAAGTDHGIFLSSDNGLPRAAAAISLSLTKDFFSPE